jgi:hypothetical protein
MAGEPVRRARRASGEVAPGTRKPGDPTPKHDAAEKRARGYQWESFQQGHFLALRSGHRSPRIVSRLAGELVDWLVAAFPDLAHDRYRLSVAALARAETLVALLVRRLDEVDVVGQDGEPRERLLRELRSTERRASEERRNLGLDPMAHSKLVRERAEATLAGFDLDAAIAKGREVLDARPLRTLDSPDDDGPAAA